MHVHKEDATDAAVDLDGRDAVDEGGNKVAAATGNTANVQISGAASLVGVGPDGSYVEVLRSRLMENGTSVSAQSCKD